MRDVLARLQRSRLVYLWAIASVAWSLHAGQHVVRHGGVLFEMAPAEAAAVLGNTLWDVARPILLAGLVVLPLALLIRLARERR